MKTICNKLRASALILSMLLVSCAQAPVTAPDNKLLVSTPESEGVDSRGIIEFLKAAGNSKHEFHSLMFLRHGRVITQGWWSPYAPGLKHTLYSASKSFTSTAVGFAVSENKLKVTDKVIPFFPEYKPDTVSRNLDDMEVRDLLSMTAGQDPDPTFIIPPADSNWVKAFLARPVVNDPGTKFLYNSLATYMLSAIVQKVTGEKVIDYLTPRLFTPLGITGMDWETDPRGINTGGWGLRLKTEDMAKFGQLLLQKGKWNGKQVLPEAWINEATTFKIDQNPGVADSIRQKNDWMQGYCYQFWRCRHNGFRGDGAFGQYIIVLPEKDAVIAITSETQDMQGVLNMVWDYLLPSIKEEKLPENLTANGELDKMISELAVALPPVTPASKLTESVSGKNFILDKNEWNIESLSFVFDKNDCELTLVEGGKDDKLKFGKTGWVIGSTSRPGPNLLNRAKAHMAGIPPVSTAGVYRWKDPSTLELTLRYIESPHTERILIAFAGDKISITRIFSFYPEPLPVVLKGRLSR
jgi:hypothetical protein